MAKFWCVNFDNEADLKHGIEENFWSMGYQYADDQTDSGNRKAVITMNWKRLKEINPGDGFAAYLSGNRFFATGTVITPRRSKASRDRTDTIDEYLKRQRSYHKGYVYFTGSVVYENFTDEFDNAPVRIDVNRWDGHVPDGVVLPIVNRIPVNERHKAAFEITKADFDRIAKTLASERTPALRKHLPSVASDGPSADQLHAIATEVADTGYFSPASLKDEREKRLREIVQRRGQQDFRNGLVAAYGGRCAVTGCDAVAALEAAHIVPFTGRESNNVSNGLLLRADIHTLFDLDLIGIDSETLTVVLAPAIRASVYANLHGRKLGRPAKATAAPNRDALARRWKRFVKGK